MISNFFGNSLEAKTRILVFNIASGLLSLAVVSYIFYFSLKYSIEAIFLNYNKSLIHLEEMRQAINRMQIHHTLFSQEQYQQNANFILGTWKCFQQNYHSNTELLFIRWIKDVYLLVENKQEVDFYQQLIKENANNIDKLDKELAIFLEFLSKAPNQIRSQAKLMKYGHELNGQISQVIKTNLQLVEVEKQQNEKFHNTLHFVVLVMMCMIMVITLYLSALILRNIKTLHMTLEEKIQEKTKALQDLNNSLQETIQKELLESRKKDQIMYQQSRLASMGEMIQNIAHQWRQPLNALTLLIQAFKVKKEHAKLTQEFIDAQVEEGLKIAKRMSQTIEDFRNFFDSSDDKECFNLKEILNDSVALVDAFLRQNEIKLHIHCDASLMLFGYKSAFSQVILNLIKNSEDVLKERQIRHAKIDIFVEQNQELMSYDEDGKQEIVKIYFTDNGGGIPPKHLQKIFEPYFTTKHKSVGTGIGLYMSKQIIEKQMQGDIAVRNVLWRTEGVGAFDEIDEIDFCIKRELDVGAQFIISIPLDKHKDEA